MGVAITNLHSVRSREKLPEKTNSHIGALLIPTLEWHLETPKEGHKLLLSGVRGIPERRD